MFNRKKFKFQITSVSKLFFGRIDSLLMLRLKMADRPLMNYILWLFEEGNRSLICLLRVFMILIERNKVNMILLSRVFILEAVLHLLLICASGISDSWPVFCIEVFKKFIFGFRSFTTILEKDLI